LSGKCRDRGFRGDARGWDLGRAWKVRHRETGTLKRKRRPPQFDLFGNPIEDRGRKAAGREIIRLDYEGERVRVVVKDGEPWWVAADVCGILKIKETHVAIRRLDDDEKGRFSIPTLGGSQEVLIVNEYGLYALILGARSRRDVPVIRDFKRWVTHEVLPTIRKTGGYALNRTAKIARKNRCDLVTAKVRGEQIDANNHSHHRLCESGATPREFAEWHNAGYRGQFGRTAAELRKVTGLPSHATPLDRMGRAPLSCNLHAKIIAEQVIKAREAEGNPIPLADQPALLERITREMAGSDLGRIGEGYIYGLIEDRKRGLVIDVVRAALSA
jgi:prophage antirepressor-like protein